MPNIEGHQQYIRNRGGERAPKDSGTIKGKIITRTSEKSTNLSVSPSSSLTVKPEETAKNFPTKILVFIKGTMTSALGIFKRLLGGNNNSVSNSGPEWAKSSSVYSEDTKTNTNGRPSETDPISNDAPIIQASEEPQARELIEIPGISQDNINAFLQLMTPKGHEEAALQTLKNIKKYTSDPENKPDNKWIPKSQNLQLDQLNKKSVKPLVKKSVKSFGWSIDQDGQIFIRTREKLGSGTSKTARNAFCLNDGKEYAHEGINKYTDWTQKSRYRGDLIPRVVESVSDKIQNNASNLQTLNVYNIPNVPPPPKLITSKTKTLQQKITAIQEKFSSDALAISMPNKKIGKSGRDYVKPKIDHFKSNKFKFYNIFKKTSDTLKVLHANGLCHTDFKPGNIGINGNDVIVIDWDDMKKTNTKMTIFTPAYCAPEVSYFRLFHKNFPMATPAMDAYTLGTTMVHMMFGFDSTLELFFTLEGYNFSVNLDNNFSFFIKKNLLQLGLKPGDGEYDILNKVMTGLLKFNPQERMTCERAHELLQGLPDK